MYCIIPILVLLVDIPILNPIGNYSIHTDQEE